MSNFLPITDYDFVAGRFKDILKNRRKSKGLTQEQLANALRVNIKTYRSWEKGTLPNAIDLFNLANLLDCDVDYLLGRMSEDSHLNKYIHNYFSLSPEAFGKLFSLYLKKTDKRESERKKMANQISMILEYLINNKEGGFMLDQIRQYVFNEKVTPAEDHIYHSLLHGVERHGVKADKNWLCLQDIIDSVRKMKEYMDSYMAEQNAARLVVVEKKDENQE